jgi:hypothetical protein
MGNQVYRTGKERTTATTTCIDDSDTNYGQGESLTDQDTGIMPFGGG